MSHIPASKMPHAHADGDTIDEQPPQPNNAQPEPEPTTATPLTSQAPATATGNRGGSQADETARDAGTPEAAGGQGSQPAVDGSVTAQDAKTASDGSSTTAKARSGLRSRTGIAALAIGGLAIAGGIAAVLFPRGEAKDESKGKKQRRRKKG